MNPLFQREAKCKPIDMKMIFILIQKSSHAHRACLHGGGGPQVGEVTRLGGVTRLSIQSLVLIWSRLRDRWGDPSRRVARSARPGNPLSRGQILPCKRSRWGNPPSRGLIREASNPCKIHFGGGFVSLLKVTIESHSTEGCSKSSNLSVEEH